LSTAAQLISTVYDIRLLINSGAILDNVTETVVGGYLRVTHNPSAPGSSHGRPNG